MVRMLRSAHGHRREHLFHIILLHEKKLSRPPSPPDVSALSRCTHTKLSSGVSHQTNFLYFLCEWKNFLCKPRRTHCSAALKRIEITTWMREWSRSLSAVFLKFPVKHAAAVGRVTCAAMWRLMKSTVADDIAQNCRAKWERREDFFSGWRAYLSPMIFPLINFFSWVSQFSATCHYCATATMNFFLWARVSFVIWQKGNEIKLS